jgi:hypothetical protein
MDQILTKHLANAFLFPKETRNTITSESSEGMVPYNSYKIIDNNYYVNTESDTIISETYGYWKDKPIIVYKDLKYVILESTQNLVRIESLGITEDNITKIPVSKVDESIIPYYYYSIKKNKLSIKIDGSTIVSEVKGYWKDKHVIVYNKEQYVVLESSKELVRLSHLGLSPNKITSKPESIKKQEENINNDLASSIKDIIKKAPKCVKKKKDLPPVEFKKEELPTSNLQPLVGVDVTKLDIPVNDEIKDVISSYVDAVKKKEVVPEPEVQPSVEKDESSTSPVNGYVDGLKGSEDPSEIIGKDLPAGGIKAGEFDFFAFLEKHKNDPRINKFFTTQTDGAKKELFAITEKYEKEFKLKLAHALESGGGTNSFGFGGEVNGTIDIKGDLKVSGQIIAPNANIGGSDVKRSIYPITGNNTFTITHNLGTKSLIVNVYDNTGEQVICGIKNISLNETVISFSEVVNNYEVVIVG